MENYTEAIQIVVFIRKNTVSHYIINVKEILNFLNILILPCPALNRPVVRSSAIQGSEAREPSAGQPGIPQGKGSESTFSTVHQQGIPQCKGSESTYSTHQTGIPYGKGPESTGTIQNTNQ